MGRECISKLRNKTILVMIFVFQFVNLVACSYKESQNNVVFIIIVMELKNL